MILAPNLAELPGLIHGFGLRDSAHPVGVRTVRQIHSSIVLHADRLEAEAQGDALIADLPGVLVGIRTADCVPILLVDPSTRVVAAVHAGWRGTAEGIVVKAVRELCAGEKTHPGGIRAAIGPSIGACCYQVGVEVARRFEIWAPEMGEADAPVFLDLRAINEIQLRDAGVADIWKSRECTFCTPEKFFSYRREREQAGRMVSFVGW